VAELGSDHGGRGRLKEVLGRRTLGRRHHWELVGHLISVMASPRSTSVSLVSMRSPSQRGASPVVLPLSSWPLDAPIPPV